MITKIIDFYTDWFKDTNRAERILMMAQMDFKLRYYDNKLGLIWALIKPLSQLAIYYVVFETILNTSIENFAIYLFIGLIMWNFFNESSGGMIRILGNKKYLYEYTNMSKMEIYLSALLSNSIGFLFNLVIFLIAAISLGVYPDAHALWFPLIWFNLFILSYAIALALSSLYLIIRDIEQVWVIASQVLFFISPIFFRGDLFRDKVPGLDFINPISGIVINTRNVIMYNQHPDWTLFAWNWFYSIILFLIGFGIFLNLSPKASEAL